jgi:hypothetical protein
MLQGKNRGVLLITKHQKQTFRPGKIEEETGNNLTKKTN